MHTPYTTRTGLKMGSRYQEHGTTEPIDDPDMLLLQEALLSSPQYIRSKHLHRLGLFLSILFLVFGIFGVLLFN
jgi:hypothetical protein